MRATLISNPENRVGYIDFSGDWWYADDLAEHYMKAGSRIDLFRRHLGERICVPDPLGDGDDLLSWLGAVC